MSTRSRTAGVSVSAAGSTIPVMKRASTSTLASAHHAGEVKMSVIASSKQPAATKRRAALGELAVAPTEGKGDGKADGKKAGAAERRPLASTQSQQPLRRTTRAASTVDVKPEPVASKRKAGPTATRRPGISRANSAATTASGSTAASSTAATRPTRALKETASLSEVSGPATKRFRASATPEDVLGDAQYDDDNHELDVRSPKRRRAKDDGWTDLDAEDEGDPTMVAEYVVDAFKYMVEIEVSLLFPFQRRTASLTNNQKNTMPDANYMEKQDELQWKMRGILNDWIIEVHSKFRLLPETLLIAINLIDRFLSLRMVSLVKFQLVGLTALFVAAKYEEVICPSITHFLHMTDGGYEVGEILRAERYLLSTLQFDLSYPNPLHFLRRVSKADAYDVHVRTIAKFFIEISCLEHKLIAFPPSMLAAAAMWLGRLCLDRGDWHANMVHYSEYAQHELLPCAQVMLDYIINPDLDTASAFYKKYASKVSFSALGFIRTCHRC